MVALWVRKREQRFAVGLWVLDFALQMVSMGLVAARGRIPDFVSMVVANTLVMVGTWALYVGLQRYLGRVTRQLHNVAYIALFATIHWYFALVHPSLAARNINLSVGVLFFSLQIIWYARFAVDREMRLAVQPTVVAFSAFSVVSAVRIVVDLFITEPTNFFKSGEFETSVVFVYGLLLVALAFVLLLMVDQLDLRDLAEEVVERKATEAEASRNAQMLRAVFDSVPDAIGVTRLSDGGILDVNRGWSDAFGHTREEALDSTALQLGLWADPDRRVAYLERLQEDGGVHAFAAQLKRKDGGVFEASIFGNEMESEGERWMLTVFHDETDTKLAEARLRELSNADPLTGILNVRAFRDAAAARLRKADRGQATLYFMDLDGLKRVNDGFGHTVGDRMLVRFAEHLGHIFRTSDVVGRMGGDEFAVLAISRESGSEGPTLERFDKALNAINEAGDLPVPISVSTGHVSWAVSAAPVDLEAVIRVADQRMYDMKARHRSRDAGTRSADMADNPH
jgi:diguanylate cyclase (GGDEF)-like protein/PAS domain S-box-containing protein